MARSPDTLARLLARDPAIQYPQIFSDREARLAKILCSYVPEAIMTTRGDIMTRGASVPQRLAVGAASYVLKSDGTDPAWGLLVNANIDAAAAIAFAKLAALPSGQVLVGSAGNVATAVAMSGDATISAAGALTIAAEAVGVSKLDPAVTKEVTGTLTQANLLAIGTPIELIAAPGAGKLIIVDEIELFHDYSTTQYATGADVQFEYGTSGDNIALVADSFVTGAADQNAIIKPSTYNLDGSTGTGVGFDVTANLNKPVQVTGSNFTNGDVANIVKYRIRYHVVTALA